ncbi:MAG: transcription-repair coupling factor, partial [Alphaproteobacteria bacterium]|nr:transcription-repair coupling factor [Alphaproteobacteria bacterium]
MSMIDMLARLAAPTVVHGAPFGYDLQALQAALQARGKLGLYVARDDKMAATAAKLASFHAPGMEVISLPGWDNLPYDRISPSPAISAARCAALARLAQRTKEAPSCLVITTASSLVQRVPPVATMRQSSFAVTTGGRVNQDELSTYLSVNGYIRTSTVSEKGEYSIRGGKIDIFAPDGHEPVRLDLFGDEVETIKAFDPETQLSTRTLKTVALAPVSEILFRENTQSLFRERYLETLGSPTGDPMYEAVRAEIRRQGVEGWLPLFHDHLETLFDYIGEDALIGMGYLASEAAAERQVQARDYYDARLEAAGGDHQAKVLAPDALYLTETELEETLSRFGVARFSPSPL